MGHFTLHPPYAPPNSLTNDGSSQYPTAAQQLEQATQRSVYKLYSIIYHSRELTHFMASKVYSIESIHNHLFRVTNWILFLLRTQAPDLLLCFGITRRTARCNP